MRRLLLLGTLIVVATAQESRHSPVAHAAVTLPDESSVLPHRGVTSPVGAGAVDAAACAFTRIAIIRWHGRVTHVYGYAVGGETYYDQADFVDPATGRLVGGVDGGGRPWREAEHQLGGKGCAGP